MQTSPVSALTPVLHNAERLVMAACTGLGTFWHEDGKYIGFRRDSQAGARVSTGGLAVISNLLHSRNQIAYFEATRSSSGLRELEERAELAARFVLRGPTVMLPKAFTSGHPLTCSRLSSVAVQSTDTHWSEWRALLAASVGPVVSTGQPPLVSQSPHPYIARRVQQACLLLLASPDARRNIRRALREPQRIRQAKIRGLGERPIRDKQQLESIRDCAHSLTPARLEGYLQVLNDYARRYLSEQLSYAPSSTDAYPTNSAPYDPVGCCFALQVLFVSRKKFDDATSLTKFLAKDASLISRTMAHVFGSLGTGGSLPYGVPFSYEGGGAGAFATSVSGLSVLAAFWAQLMRVARRSNYPFQDFFSGVLEKQRDGFHTLFGISQTLQGSARELTTKDGMVQGWSTDRAPSDDRLDGWVTGDVFHFALNLHEAAQEILEFEILKKHGATIPTDKPAWPYDARGRRIESTAGPLFVDPDKPSGTRLPALTHDPDNQAPMHYLHWTFEQFFPENGGHRTADVPWKQEAGSVVLYGPPGTAKTTLAQSLAQVLGWHYLELSPSHFIVRGMENLEERATEIFQEIETLREVVVLLDELDSVCIDRDRLKHGEMLAFVVPAMLPRLQRLRQRFRSQRALLIIATNFYERIDPAVIRKGRVDARLLMLPHNAAARREILDRSDTRAMGTVQRKRRLDRLTASTPLFVFEELKDQAKDDNATAENAAIAASSYSSRMPRLSPDIASQAEVNPAGLTRLSNEIVQLAARFCDLPRSAHRPEKLQAILDAETSPARRTVAKEWAALLQHLSSVKRVHGRKEGSDASHTPVGRRSRRSP